MAAKPCAPRGKILKKRKDTSSILYPRASHLRAFAFFAALIVSTLLTAPAALACCPIGACVPPDCAGAASHITRFHAEAEPKIKEHTAEEANIHRDWLTSTFLRQHFVPSLQKMIEQMSAVSFMNASAVGGMIDAKNQMETLRDIQIGQYNAYKDYQPSKSFCTFGTNVRSLHAAEAKAGYTASALGARSLKRSLGQKGTAAEGSKFNELSSRWQDFTENYCDLEDNNDGMTLACNGTAGARPNADVNFTALIEADNYITGEFNITGDFTKDDLKTADNKDAKDISALMSYLFNHDIQAKDFVSKIKESGSQQNYMALRSISAKRSVAESSFASLVALKNEGTDSNARDFLSPIVQAVGGNIADIGTNPSYYTQLEVLAKRIYQNPNFFAQLYDSQINTERKGAAMKAVELMVDRAIAESEMRQEMVMSVLLTSRMRAQVRDTEQNISELRRSKR